MENKGEKKIMAKTKKRTQSEIDGVQYRRAKLWQILLYACNGLVGMGIYQLIGMASYAASIGFGIATVAVGVILTSTRILDAITDPMLAFVYDRVNTKFGKIRILLISGFIIEAIALLAMYDWVAGKGFGVAVFIILYVVYVIGYTLANMTAQTIPPLLTNDPKQRPTVGVWTTIVNYMTPMILSIVLNAVVLPKFGGTYNLEFLAAACKLTLVIAAIGVILVCIAVSEYDKPENFVGLQEKKEPLKVKDMIEVLKDNRPLQCYIVSAASDKLAQQTAAQAVITTMLNGIVIGNMGLASILGVIGMIPSIIFAAVGAKYAGKFGSQRTIVTWTKISVGVSVVMFLFFVAIDPSKIAQMSAMTIIYVLLTFCKNGAMMCVSTANTSFMSDIIDYELDRSGRYIPAVVTGVYSFLDKIISSVSALVAAGAVAVIGYTKTMPQPGEACTPQIFWLTMIVTFGLPILGWICTLIAMKFCKLDKDEMIAVQKRIENKKNAAKTEGN